MFSLPDGVGLRHVEEKDFAERVETHREAWYKSSFDLDRYLNLPDAAGARQLYLKTFSHVIMRLNAETSYSWANMYWAQKGPTEDVSVLRRT